MLRNMKGVALTLVALLVLGLSVMAYAGANGGDAAKTPAAAGATVTVAATTAGEDESVAANGPEEQEKAETEKAGGADPVEAPGTPGYEEGDFGGQHEF